MFCYTWEIIEIKGRDHETGKETSRNVEAFVADDTGLAFIVHLDEEDDEGYPITLTHLKSGTRIGGCWQAYNRKDAHDWIMALNEIADWTGDVPQIRPGKLNTVLHLAVIGALHEASNPCEGA